MKHFYQLFLLTALCLISFVTKAQQRKPLPPPEPLAYEKGDQTLQLGVGLGATFSTGSVKVPALQAHYDYGLTEEISLGGIVGYAASSGQSVDYSYLIAGVRGNYHFETGTKFDPYGGATLGYNKVNISGNKIGNFYDGSSVLYGAQIGANYYFTPKVAAWAELGYGLGYLNLGITFKL